MSKKNKIVWSSLSTKKLNEIIAVGGARKQKAINELNKRMKGAR